MKIKNFILAITCCLLTCTLSGCGDKEPPKPDTLHVTFKNYDDSVLYHTKVNYGEKVEYEGPTPTKDKTISHHYEFSNWDKSINEPIIDNMVFNAQFNEIYNKYEVKFLNYDDSVLDTCFVDYGSKASYSKENPQKPSNDKHVEYLFTGWDKDIKSTEILKDTTFKAIYNTEYYNFAEFYNYDDSLLYTSKVKKGETPSYNGILPTREYEGNDKKAYKFTGWDSQITPINQDVKFTAQYDLLNVYNVVFKNYDGETLYTDEVIHGESAIYNGSTPYKPGYTSGRYKYTYTFSGWSGSLENIISDTILTATFSEHSEYQKTDQERIQEHLRIYGEGSYNNVVTGYNTYLGYKGSNFNTGFLKEDPNGTTMTATGLFEFGHITGSGLFVLEYQGIKMFEVYFTIFTYDHCYEGYGGYNITVNHLDVETMEAVSIAIPTALRSMIDNASGYLSDNGLPYIW